MPPQSLPRGAADCYKVERGELRLPGQICTGWALHSNIPPMEPQAEKSRRKVQPWLWPGLLLAGGELRPPVFVQWREGEGAPWTPPSRHNHLSKAPPPNALPWGQEFIPDLQGILAEP